VTEIFIFGLAREKRVRECQWKRDRQGENEVGTRKRDDRKRQKRVKERARNYYSCSTLKYIEKIMFWCYERTLTIDVQFPLEKHKFSFKIVIELLVHQCGEFISSLTNKDFQNRTLFEILELPRCFFFS